MSNLEQYRKQIDAIDGEILELLSKRLILSEKIGGYKKEHKLAVSDKEREGIILSSMEKLGQTKNLSKEFIHSIYKVIIAESRNRQ